MVAPIGLSSSIPKGQDRPVCIWGKWAGEPVLTLVYYTEGAENSNETPKV